jgi:hypothetical protein
MTLQWLYFSAFMRGFDVWQGLGSVFRIPTQHELSLALKTRLGV